MFDECDENAKLRFDELLKDDPVLLAHRVAPLRCELGWMIFPVSIKEQMLRACLIVDRARECGVISKDRPLLVIGAGATGVTAAIRAARKGVPTHLVEKQKKAFLRQWYSVSRFICPTQYDWPMSHWEEMRFPWNDESAIPAERRMPLHWIAERADEIAKNWTEQFERAIQFQHNLEVSFELAVNLSKTTRLKNRETDDDFANVSFIYPKPNEDYSNDEGRRYGLILSCVGPGEELCELDTDRCGIKYFGCKFWQTDFLTELNLGLTGDKKPRVLIIGGGDGALQDFIRCVTGIEYASQLFNALPFADLDRIELERKILQAEDQAQRAFIWNKSEKHDCLYLQELHRVYKEIVNDIKNWATVKTVLDEIITSRGRLDQVSLIHLCHHFGKCYALNHFLVLLIARYFEEIGRGFDKVMPSIISGKKVLRVSEHACPGTRSEWLLCYGETHIVEFADGSCTARSQDDASFEDLPGYDKKEFNVIIVRTGISRPIPQYGEMRIGNPRQLLPYHLL